jgi:hypothetical protein
VLGLGVSNDMNFVRHNGEIIRSSIAGTLGRKIEAILYPVNPLRHKPRSCTTNSKLNLAWLCNESGTQNGY